MSESAASALLPTPRCAGVTAARSLQCGANTPWNRVRCIRGGDTSAASLGTGGPHVYANREELLILEGEAIEDDGTVLKAGDWIVYGPKRFHGTRAVTGCVLPGLGWKPPEQRS